VKWIGSGIAIQNSSVGASTCDWNPLTAASAPLSRSMAHASSTSATTTLGMKAIAVFIVCRLRQPTRAA
jgi:hypothetical protein